MPETTNTPIPTRAEIPVESTWNTDSIFPTPEAWETEFEALKAEGAESVAAKFKGRLAEGPETVATYLTAAETLQKRVGPVMVYASLRYSVDTFDQESAGRADRARGLWARTAAALAFAEPELLAIGADTLLLWADADMAGLGNYRHLFDQIGKRAAHVRSGEVEEVLKAAGEAFGSAASIHGVLANTDLTYAPATDDEGGTHEIGQGTIGKLINTSDRTTRRTAFESYADAHLAYKNTMAACLATGIKQDVFLAKARGYADSLDAALSPNFIPVDVFTSLIETFQKNVPTWHRYWGLRRRALKLDKLAPYDIKAPLTASEPVVPYAQAVDWISEGMAPLGEEYVEVLRKGSTTDRWVDIYPNKGKRLGAFSSGVPSTNPFIMMSYNDDLAGLSTLAHELGHSMHSYLSWQTQPFVYGRYGLFAAEVASNFNQALVRGYLLEKFKDDRDFQIAIIEEAMANFHRYFFVMPTLARFEREIHDQVWRGEALTAQSLTNLMADLFAEAFGPEVETHGPMRDRIGSTWMQFSTHLYSNFYVFQYATGISGAHALADRVRSGGLSAAQDYLTFLRAGGSMYPLDALKRAGVDLSTPDPVEKTFGVLASYVDRLEELVG